VTAPVPSGAVADFEKLGAFYLGRRWDEGSLGEAPVLYDAKDLTTHAVCVGMTGSGKTGLCVTLLEEAAIDGVPAICIDPKGDLANLMLTFPSLRGEDFAPWIDPADAARRGMSVSERADAVATSWREGLAAWGQDGARVARFADSVERRVLTPGGSVAPVNVLRSLAAPSGLDADGLRERALCAVSSILALLGLDADPIQSREHVFLSTLLTRAWGEGRTLELGGLVREVMQPPISRIGVLELDVFFPSKDRQALAMKLNALLASPGFAAWLEGEPLDVGSMLWSPEGKPRLTILSIAHLGDAERMFFVTLLLGEIVSWMRAQSGTPSLRALLYMDEVFGFLPPVANPPSKTPLLTLLKQARAYGLGVLLATQNPVDLDYKALSNCGTWWLGRLQTERDVERVVDGLASSGAPVSAADLRRQLAGLRSRVFAMRNVHESEPVTFHSRWALSYLSGPMTRVQLAELVADSKLVDASGAEAGRDGSAKARTGVGANAPAVAVGARAAGAAGSSAVGAARAAGAGAAGSSAVGAAGGGAAGSSAVGSSAARSMDLARARPVVPEHVEEVFVGEALGDFVYRPALLATLRLHYVLVRADVDAWFTQSLLAPLDEASKDLWEEARIFGPDLAVASDPSAPAPFAELPPSALGKRAMRSAEAAVKRHVYRAHPMTIGHCEALKLYSQVGESYAAFQARVTQGAREARDLELAKVRARFAKRYEKLEARIARAEAKVERERGQASTAGVGTAVDVGATVLGALLGRRTSAYTHARRVAGAAKKGARAREQQRDVVRAEEALEDLKGELEELEAELDEALAEVRGAADVPAIDRVEIRPRKGDIEVARFALAWIAESR